MNNKVVKWVLEEEDQKSVDRIALVDDPAIQVDFLPFKAIQSDKFDKLDDSEVSEVMFYQAYEAERESKRRFEVDPSNFEHLKGQNLIFAPIMIADKLIIREREDGELYYGYFPSESIRKAAYYFVSEKLVDSWNLMHDASQETNQVELIESWIVEDSENDKSNFFGYRLEAGSWVGMLRIKNQELYDTYIKSGDIKGVSVEAWVTETALTKSESSRE